MTLEEILNLELDRSGKRILLLGRPSAGKTWLSNQLNNLDHKTIHTDNYREFAEPMAIQAIIEDEADIQRYYNAGSIIEGVLGYPLLLTGLKEQSYRPDIVIEVEISSGKQRELYLAERNPDKIKYLKKFLMKTMAILDEYYKLVPESEMPTWLILNNNW
jgi:adenylate kinase family enzyme